MSIARSELRVAKSASRATAVLIMSVYRYPDEIKHIAAASDFFLDAGDIENARHVLSVGINHICSGGGGTSRLLWNKWLSLEHQFGDKRSLRTVESLRVCRRHINCDDVNGDLLTRPSCPPRDPVNRCSGVDCQTIASPSPEEARSADDCGGGGEDDSLTREDWSSRMRMFAGGDSARELSERYKLGGTYLRTLLIDKLMEKHGTGATTAAGDRDQTCPAANEAVDGAGEEDDGDGDAAFPTTSLVSRPDVIRMAIFKPATSSIDPDDPAMAASSRLPFVPRALEDLLHVLPKIASRRGSSDFNWTAMVDYAMLGLLSVSIPPVRLSDHKPLPIVKMARSMAAMGLRDKAGGVGVGGVGGGAAVGGESSSMMTMMASGDEEDLLVPLSSRTLDNDDDVGGVGPYLTFRRLDGGGEEGGDVFRQRAKSRAGRRLL